MIPTSNSKMSDAEAAQLLQHHKSHLEHLTKYDTVSEEYISYLLDPSDGDSGHRLAEAIGIALQHLLKGASTDGQYPRAS